MRIAVLQAVVLLFPTSLLPCAHAGTLYVDVRACPGQGTGTQADPFCRIQDAIQAASDGDTILVAPGRYVENIDFLGKAVTVRSTGGPTSTTIDANRAGSVVTRCASPRPPRPPRRATSPTCSRALAMAPSSLQPPASSFQAPASSFQGPLVSP